MNDCGCYLDFIPQLGGSAEEQDYIDVRVNADAVMPSVAYVPRSLAIPLGVSVALNLTSPSCNSSLPGMRDSELMMKSPDIRTF